MAAPRIVVVGSLNVDRTFRVPRLPAAGETLTAQEVITGFGGKGANQALAAARAGAQVSLVGCVGDDDAGQRYRDHLARHGIDTGPVRTAPETPTGSAHIAVDDAGENTILVHPGANHELTGDDLGNEVFEGSEVVLLQLECALPTVERAARLARCAGATVILNPSPWPDSGLPVHWPVDCLIVNESEARALTGQGVDSLQEDPAPLLSATEASTVIVTRGASPTLALVRDTASMLVASPPAVEPVDTVGAGDTFAGAFAVATARGDGLAQALTFANAAAALATQKVGAQPAIPTLEEIRTFLGSLASTR